MCSPASSARSARTSRGTVAGQSSHRSLRSLALFLVLQACPAAATAALRASSPPSGPILVPLEKMAVPVRQGGKVVSYKYSYAGSIKIGSRNTPQQEFKVVFDTGSGQVVVPDVKCTATGCLTHKRYDIRKSAEAYPVNADNTKPVGTRDEIEVEYGTGRVEGEFVRDAVCVGTDDNSECIDMNLVTATFLSDVPFSEFEFDGIFGLGLDQLAVSPQFSFFNRLMNKRGPGAGQFGIYMAPSDSKEAVHEIAIAGYNAKRLRSPLAWTPVAIPEQGYWQVDVKAVRIGNQTLDVCAAGCRGIVDTGSSHLGVPRSSMLEVFTKLSMVPNDKGDDCRAVRSPDIHIDLDGFSLTLGAEEYMRTLPTKDYVPPGQEAAEDSYTCRPKLMPVAGAPQTETGAPATPLLILGEPIFARYYTVFEREKLQVGFGLARHGEEETDDVVLLVQVTLRLSSRPVAGRAVGGRRALRALPARPVLPALPAP